MDSRRVVLYGQSMLLSLVAASLRKSENLQVLQVTAWEEIDASLADCIPDVLIYDLDAAPELHILQLLFTNPYLLLIGLDVETNRAMVLAGKEARSLTLARVKELILTC